MGADGLQKAWSKRHSAATKQGIKKAKARNKVVRKATLALRKSKKQEIVQQLFTPKPRPEPEPEPAEEAAATPADSPRPDPA